MQSSSNVVRIVDATLREGAQAPGVGFTIAQSRRIARMLDALGVEIIECGHPFASPQQAKRVSALVELGLKAEILAHARAREEDVAAVAKSGAAWAGIFCGVNEIARETRLGGRSVADVLTMARAAVGVAKSLGLKARFTLEDATRTDPDLALEAFAAAVEAGADRVCLADTVGAATPAEFAAQVRALCQAFPGVALEVHAHDDRGFAAANVFAAVEAGAGWISTSVNGLGERCGVPDLALTLANLDHAGLRPLADGAALQRLSAYVAEVTGEAPDARRPVVGRNAFTHVARLHAIAVRRDPNAYSVFDAERLARTNEVAGDAEPETDERRAVVALGAAS